MGFLIYTFRFKNYAPMENSIVRKLKYHEDRIGTLFRKICKLEEAGGGTETDPIFSASAAFGISSGDINNWNDATGLAHEHFNKTTLDGITVSRVNNWDSAYTATQSLSTTYFPLVGGTITGTAGNGFIGLSLQSSAPTVPATGVRLFSDSTSRFSWKTPLDAFTRTITTTAAITADRVWSFPDSSGEVMVSGPAQTMAGVKTFSSNISHGGNITPTVNGTRLLGSASFQYLSAYTRAVIGDSLFIGANSTTNLTFGYNGGANISATLFNGGNFLIQNGGTHTNAGYLLDVTGTTRLNGNVTVGGSVNPDGDATRNLGSQTARWQLFVSTLLKGNNTNGMNFAGATGSDVFLRFQPTTHNAVFQNAGAGIAETGYRVSIDGTSATNGAFQVTNGVSSFGGNVSITGNLLMSGQILPDSDNTRTLGSSTLRMSTVYAIHVSKGNIGNSFNLAVTNTTDIYMRVQPTTNNFVFQQSGTAPAETGYKVTVDGTGAANGALFVNNGTATFSGSILASGNGTIDIGTTSNRIANIYTLSVRGNGTLRLTAGTTNSIVFSQTADTNTIGQFFATTGALGLQAPAALMTDDGVNRLQVAGSVKATQYRLSALNTAPTSATDTGTLGEIRIDASFIYVATATNTWKRAALTTW